MWICRVQEKGLDNQENGRGDPLRWPWNTVSSKIGTIFADKRRSLSVGIIRSLTKTTKFVLFVRKVEHILQTFCLDNARLGGYSFHRMKQLLRKFPPHPHPAHLRFSLRDNRTASHYSLKKCLKMHAHFLGPSVYCCCRGRDCTWDVAFKPSLII
jgi:hypothetical protein